MTLRTVIFSACPWGSEMLNFTRLLIFHLGRGQTLSREKMHIQLNFPQSSLPTAWWSVSSACPFFFISLTMNVSKRRYTLQFSSRNFDGKMQNRRQLLAVPDYGSSKTKHQRLSYSTWTGYSNMKRVLKTVVHWGNPRSHCHKHALVVRHWIWPQAQLMPPTTTASYLAEGPVLF